MNSPYPYSYEQEWCQSIGDPNTFKQITDIIIVIAFWVTSKTALRNPIFDEIYQSD